MSNPQGPNRDAERIPGDDEDTVAADAVSEPATEVFNTTDDADRETPTVTPGERRFTAPSGFDAGSTQIIGRAAEPATEIIRGPGPHEPNTDSLKTVGPQAIPPRGEVPKPPKRPSRGTWGWVVAVILVIAALAAVAILGTLLLSRKNNASASKEDQVRTTIESFDTAIQKGDLSTLRSITCGSTAESYNKYDDKQWTDIHTRVAAAKQYPVVASVDEVVVNGDHAEANVNSFMAFDPATRSTRSFDLEFRDGQWKICQAPGS